METGRLRTAPDGSEALAAETWVGRALDQEFQLRNEFLTVCRWVVAPVESSGHFDDRESERIARAIELQGKDRVRALLLEPVSGARNHLEVPATGAGFRLFNQECSHFTYILVPYDHSFAIVCTTDDYYLHAGSIEFVEAAAGMSLPEALSAFREFGQDPSWQPPDRSRLRRLLERYGPS